MAFSLNSQAQSSSKWWSGGYDYTQRATKREQTRWSLSDWLNIKEKNRAMDQWLSLNSPSPFEFMIGGSYLSYNSNVNDGSTTTENSHTSYSGELAAYAQLVGLSGEYEHNSADNFTDLTGIFNLRVLGDSIQNSGLTLSYGMRTREQEGTTPTRLSQQFGQVQLQLYLMKYFGFDGKYRYFLPTTNDELGDVKGDYSEAGLFIDFKGLRVFGAWYKENQKNKIPAATVDTITDRTGIRSGIKIFF
ncbi:MAG: hypothetical protein J7501_11310 [Bdellovibrio sp.]|nr:hypothetical protein [Bdellovibrio sp.]